MTMAVDPNLKPELSKRHREELSALLQKNFTWGDCNDTDSVATLLVQRPVDIAYLYCHGGYDKDDGLPFLQFGNRKLYPTDLATWQMIILLPAHRQPRGLPRGSHACGTYARWSIAQDRCRQQ